ncbi:MAG: PAS domain-containing protein [Planctomycetota bacterium]|nr:MAG: PAS domain-containing protein [Planctomycetota bacterium]
MSRDSILIMDPAGTIVWANRLAHDIVGLPPGGLLGRNYLEVTPPDTHAQLLKLHQRKLEGETVCFRIALKGRVLRTTSGLVHVNGRGYLFAVGRWAAGPPLGDEVLLGELAVGELLHESRTRVDLNALLVGVLREEARALKGRLALEPGDPPEIQARPWPIRTVLRHLLLQTRTQRGRAAVSTGGDPKAGLDPHPASPQRGIEERGAGDVPPHRPRTGRTPARRRPGDAPLPPGLTASGMHHKVTKDTKRLFFVLFVPLW